MLCAVEDGSARRERVRRLLEEVPGGSRLVMVGPQYAEGGSGAAAGRALGPARQHLAVVCRALRPLLDDTEAAEELVDLAVAALAAGEALRVASMVPVRRRDVGFAGARVARCSAEALRAHATLVALPVGAPVPDVSPGLLRLICDLSARLRTAGREGPSGRRWDAGVEARDAADLVVTTYRRWRPRLRGATADQVAHVAVAAAQTAVWCGFASIGLDEDDACGRAVSPVTSPPGLTMAAAAEPPPAPAPPVCADSAASRCRGVEPAALR
jgi:hypothetical protein